MMKSDVKNQVFDQLEKIVFVHLEVHHMRIHYHQMWCPLRAQVEAPVWRQTKRQVHDQIQDQIRLDVREVYLYD